MGIIFRVAELLLLLVPVAGVVIAGLNVWKRVQRSSDSPPPADDRRAALAEPAAPQPAANPAVQWRAITRTVSEHDRVDQRWMAYELDVEKLLDFPMMTDLRDPLTTAFHKAKLRADLLRPAKAEDLLDDRESAGQYLAAVGEYAAAFNLAEAEAIRRRRSDFSTEEGQRLARARSLLNVASDASASPHERERAYALAVKELDGLVVLPEATRLGIERGLTGELDG